ncbi:dimethylaniline monooxygenase [N-oxide-forming] 5-like isoform X2 [Rhinatrema bivittatum]|uniref:dimethylaniline monooxygenase [N-oxide-forming] 5-like isoform X2 n=1 Tax=Rhinatrema bivittatum TaxID=194408 RepID=UPI001127FA14|nr:dimethylaniline monooxygenase [N-oxide-forming] 5-like isoform X2 [Rhinatrema bivittatum]
MVKRVAVIGAGASGLVCIKSCVDEGLEPTCFERTDDLGGLWKFKTLVRSVRKCPDFSSTGQWEVVTEMDGKQESAIFDAVLVCTGHHTDPHLPLESFPGIEKFKGRYFHSRDYKDPDEFLGKRIIVIGIGNSGGDIAVELSRTAQQVFLSTRRGSWIVNRVSDHGYPVDMLTSRFLNMIKHTFPSSLVNWVGESKLNHRFDHANYGLKPNHRIFSQHPMVNDDLPNRILAGTVLVKPNVKKFTETSAIFEDGTEEDNIDVVVFATGYSFAFPFFEESVIKVHTNQVSLYKYVFPPDLEKPSVAIIGLIQPLGAIMPISELQARWATRVFKGVNQLPPASNMKSDIAWKKKVMQKRYVTSNRHTIQVDYVDYMDELATVVGVKPNILNLFLMDPKLAKEVFFGPCTPYQYRLTGPGKWSGARQAILTQWDRILKPTRTRVLTTHSSQSSVPMLLKLLGLVVLFAAWYFYSF